MLKLILMRHAKSSWDDPFIGDHDRPLNARGVASAKAMGDWLRRHGHKPDWALSSSSRRTMQTFEGLALDCPIKFTKRLFHASANEILDQLRQTTQTNALLLGHNPGIADLAAQIVRTPPIHSDFTRFPTCATLVAEFDQKDWRSTDWQTGVATDFAIPREIIGSID